MFSISAFLEHDNFLFFNVNDQRPRKQLRDQVELFHMYRLCVRYFRIDKYVYALCIQHT